MKKNRSSWIGTACVLLIVAAVVSGCPGMAVVIIPDHALESAIRAGLGRPFGLLREMDVQRLNELDARSLGIGDLRGLEACTSLTWLNLDTNDATDIGPLAGLVNLRYLNLESNDISDLLPLSGLWYLEEILLSGNQVWDLAPLVANAENGGIGFNTVITLDSATLTDENGDLLPAVAEQVARLTALGVTLIFTEPA